MKPTANSSPFSPNDPIVQPAGESPLSRTVEKLEPLLTEARVRRMRNVLATRSDHVAFVFERMIDPHNLSAALRSLDAFSFQDVHLVEPGERLDWAGKSTTEKNTAGKGLSRGITIGTDRWLTLHTAPNSLDCLEGLRREGYTILAGHLEEAGAVSLTDIDFTRKTALVFGNEHLGVGEEMVAGADGFFRIDMLGFAQSLNLSVSVAVSAFHARQELTRLAKDSVDPGRFSRHPEKQEALYAQWLRNSVKHAERILAED